MNTFNVEGFHNNCFRYFKDHREKEIKNICMMETTMEKWFQGEAALSSTRFGYKILSSEIYNSVENDHPGWKKYSDDWRYVITEASVYKDSRQKADIIIENEEETLVSEIKFFWMYDTVINNEGDYREVHAILKTNEVFKDVIKLKTLKQSYRNSHLCLTLFGSIDRTCFNFDEDINEAINWSFEKERIKPKKIIINKICDFETDYSELEKDHQKYKYDFYIITIDLSKILF